MRSLWVVVSYFPMQAKAVAFEYFTEIEADLKLESLQRQYPELIHGIITNYKGHYDRPSTHETN